MIDIAKFTYRGIKPLYKSDALTLTPTLIYEVKDLNSLKDLEGFLFGLEFKKNPNINFLITIKNQRETFKYSVVKEFNRYRIVTT